MDDDLKARLLKPRLPEAEVDVPGIGVVRVRGLNRVEAMAIQGTKGEEAIERKIIAFSCGITEAEAGEWQKAGTAGELDEVSSKIAELSGLYDGAPKEAVKSLRSEP